MAISVRFNCIGPSRNDNYSAQVIISNGNINLEETISITADADDNMSPINNAHQVLSKGGASLRIQHINGQIPADIYCCMASQMGNSTFTNVDLCDTYRPLVIDPTVAMIRLLI
jgi:hypothetical protein